MEFGDVWWICLAPAFTLSYLVYDFPLPYLDQGGFTFYEYQGGLSGPPHIILF
jgi:hypothetical protein